MNPEETDIFAVLDEWLCYCNRFAKTTQKYYRRVIKRFITFLDIETIDQISCRKIEKYISNSLGEGLKNSTANLHLRTIKTFCCWLARNYEVKNYSKGIRRLRTDPAEPRVLTWEEYQKVLSVCSETETDIIRFLFNTGCRCSEFVNLRWRDVSKDLKMLTVLGKGRKKRYVPLNDVCRGILQKYERGPDDTLLHFLRNCKARRTLYKNCARVSKRAGIPIAGPHSYRHCFATTLLLRGVPISHVSKLLGHSSIAITEKAYIHFMPDYLNGITDVLAEGVI